jgi:hypothetical protein
MREKMGEGENAPFTVTLKKKKNDILGILRCAAPYHAEGSPPLPVDRAIADADIDTGHQTAAEAEAQSGRRTSNA